MGAVSQTGVKTLKQEDGIDLHFSFILSQLQARNQWNSFVHLFMTHEKHFCPELID